MADTPEAPITPVVTPVTPAIEATPAVSAPTDSSVTETPAVVETAVETPATPATEAPVEAAIENVLGAEPAKVEEVKVEPEKKDPPKAEDAKPVDAKVETPAETKIELPVYDEFKVPENVTLDKEPLEAFTKILGKIESGKLDHAGMQAAGQELIDLAAKNTVEQINRLNDYYVQVHNDQKSNWFKALKADPDMGGDKIDQTMSALQATVAEYGGNTEQIASFRKMVTETGVTNNPDLCRLIFNMQKKINKYTTEDGSNRIVPGAKPAPTKVKPYQTFYTGS